MSLSLLIKLTFLFFGFPCFSGQHQHPTLARRHPFQQAPCYLSLVECIWLHMVPSEDLCESSSLHSVLSWETSLYLDHFHFHRSPPQRRSTLWLLSAAHPLGGRDQQHGSSPATFQGVHLTHRKLPNPPHPRWWVGKLSLSPAPFLVLSPLAVLFALVQGSQGPTDKSNGQDSIQMSDDLSCRHLCTK